MKAVISERTQLWGKNITFTQSFSNSLKYICLGNVRKNKTKQNSRRKTTGPNQGKLCTKLYDPRMQVSTEIPKSHGTRTKIIFLTKSVRLYISLSKFKLKSLL